MSLTFRIQKLKNPTYKLNTKTYNTGRSKTRQEFTKECDINRIVNTFKTTGHLPFNGKESLGIYADVSELPDFKSSLDFIIYAKDSFNKLDVNVRERFHNSPAELMDFLKNPENDEEGRKLGLIQPKRPPEKNPAPKEPIATDKAVEKPKTPLVKDVKKD